MDREELQNKLNEKLSKFIGKIADEQTIKEIQKEMIDFQEHYLKEFEDK